MLVQGTRLHTRSEDKNVDGEELGSCCPWPPEIEETSLKVKLPKKLLTALRDPSLDLNTAASVIFQRVADCGIATSLCAAMPLAPKCARAGGE